MTENRKPPSREFPELPNSKHVVALATALGREVFFFSASVIGFSYAVSHGGDAMYCTAFGVFAIVAFVYLVRRRTKLK